MPVEQTSNRRDLLRLGLGISLGAIAGTALGGASEVVEDSINEHTSYYAGDVGMDEAMEASCSSPADRSCVDRLLYRPQAVYWQLGPHPVEVESTFRAIPSALLDLYNKALPRSDEPITNVFTGGGENWGLSRREAIFGAAVTWYTAYAGNVTSKGDNFDTIPAKNLMAGGVFWWLQRRFGLAANVTGRAVMDGVRLMRVPGRYQRAAARKASVPREK